MTLGRTERLMRMTPVANARHQKTKGYAARHNPLNFLASRPGLEPAGDEYDADLARLRAPGLEVWRDQVLISAYTGAANCTR